MADRRISHLGALLNQQAISQEILQECLTKAEAMAQVTVSTDFLELSESVIYNYLWLLSDTISKARNMNERLLNTLLKERLLKFDEADASANKITG